MIRVIANGCNGVMGQILTNCIESHEGIEIIAGIDRTPERHKNPYPVYLDIFQCREKADVIIDFSNPYCLPGLLDYSIEHDMPLVIATTGFSPNDLKDVAMAAKKVPLFYSANMSLGINILIDLVKKASLLLHDSFDIEIIEKHHNKKVDAPSGTAYMIANSINEELKNTMEYIFGRYNKMDKRRNNEIGIHSIRGGTIVGEHSVLFTGHDEIIEITHKAASKTIFAVGAIKAAKFLVNKPKGLYSMDHLIDFL